MDKIRCVVSTRGVVLAMILCALAVSSVAPHAGAAGTPKVKITLENTEADLELFIAQARSEADAIAMQMQSEIFGARTDGKLKRVLKLEKKFDKRIRKVMGSYDKAVAKAYRRAYAQSVKESGDPPRLTREIVLMEGAAGSMRIIRDSLETDLATIVSEAVGELTAE